MESNFEIHLGALHRKVFLVGCDVRHTL